LYRVSRREIAAPLTITNIKIEAQVPDGINVKICIC
jgi:hypothetical protein